MSRELIPVTALRSPLSRLDRISAVAETGATVLDVLVRLGLAERPVRVMVGDEVIPRDAWARTTLGDPARPMVVMAVPGDPITGAILTIMSAIMSAVTATAPGWVTGAMAWGAGVGAGLGGALGLGGAGITMMSIGTGLIVGLGVSAGVGMVAQLAMSALIKPQSGGSLGGGSSTSPTLQGTQNRAYPYSPVWRVFGTYWVTFPLAAKPFSESVGGEVYLRMLFTAGYGPLSFGDFKIGDTALTDFTGVELQVYDGEKTWQMNPGEPVVEIPEITLFSEDVDEDSPGVSFDPPSPNNSAVEPSEWVVRTTSPGTYHLAVDLTFPGGLYKAGDSGNTYEEEVTFEVELKPFDQPDSAYFSPTLVDFGLYHNPYPAGLITTYFNVKAKRSDGFVTGFAIRAGLTGQDTIRIRRFKTAPHGHGTTTISTATWSSFRSIKALAYSAMPNVTLLALRIKASDQLNGVVSEFRGRVSSKLRPYLGIGQPGADADGLGPYEVSRNPAWAYLHVLVGPEATRPLSIARVDVERLAAWAEYCEPSPGNYVHAVDVVLDWAATQHAVLQLISGAARGTYAVRDGLQSVVLDVPKPAPVQAFTPRNSWDYKGRRRHMEHPHALRVNLPNEDVENQTDEVIVYDDGYDASNATEFETVEAVGITSTDQAWRHGRYLQRVARERSEYHEITADIEYIVAERGDRVLLSHDVPQTDVRFGRITSTLDTIGLRHGFDLDEELVYEDGVLYTAVIRWLKGDEIQFTTIERGEFLPHPTNHHFAFNLPVPDDADFAWQVGDLVSIGRSEQTTIDAIVHQVTPGPNLSATLLLTEYAGDVIFASETPPAHVSQLTAALSPNPPTPVIIGVSSIDGALVISFSPSPTLDARAPVVRVQAQYRTASVPVGPWVDVPSVLPSDGRITISLPVGVYYDLRIRAVGSKTVSLWATRSGYAHLRESYVATDFSIVGFEVKNRGVDNAWTGRDLEVTWRLAVLAYVGGPTPPGFNGFRVTVTDAESGAVRRTQVISDPRYNYSLNRNVEDSLRLSNGENGFGARRVVVMVSALDDVGGESTPLTRTIENAAPTVPNILPTQTSLGINIYWTAATDPDATKILVWRGATDDFAIGPASLIYAGVENPLFLDTRQVADEWYRFARADEFSEDPTQLNVSAARHIEPGDLISDDDIEPGAISETDYESVEAGGPLLSTGSPDTNWWYLPYTPPVYNSPSHYKHGIIWNFPLVVPPLGEKIRISLSMILSLGSDAQANTDIIYNVAMTTSALGGQLAARNMGGGAFYFTGAYSLVHGVRVARFDRIVLRRTASIANDVVLSAVALWPPDDAAPFLTVGSTQYLDLTVLRWLADNPGASNSYALQYEQVLIEALRIKR